MKSAKLATLIGFNMRSLPAKIGRTGFLVPIRRLDLVAEKIAWLADHPAEAREMGRCARQRAGEFTWAGYGEKVAAGLLAGSGNNFR